MGAPRILIGCVSRPCKNGNVAPRNKQGRCLCAACKAAVYAKRNEWRKNNPEKANAHSAKWRATNPEKSREANKAWKNANPDKLAKYNYKSGVKWSQNNKGKRNAIRAKTIAKSISRLPMWSNLVEIESIYKEASQKSLDTGIPHEVDHIIPMQGEYVSGLHVPGNLQIITRAQNRSKGHRWASENV